MKLTLTVIVRVVKSSTSAAVRRTDRSVKKYLCVAEIQNRILRGQVGQIRNNV